MNVRELHIVRVVELDLAQVDSSKITGLSNVGLVSKYFCHKGVEYARIINYCSPFFGWTRRISNSGQ